MPDVEHGDGLYDVTFTYRVNDEIQTGSFKIGGTERSASPYSRGDIFTLSYNPKCPSRFYYANERSGLEKVGLIFFFIMIGICGAFLMITLLPQ
jgi:hypothetical protein